jgi:glycerol-3-phosphate dehydrogenase
MSIPHIIVIGAGSTGSATAHDLALRGLRVTLIERGDIASGTTGRTHCLLHSGGRYCVNDPEAAAECIVENRIIRNIIPDLLELNDGLFVALTEADLAFKERFLEGCATCHIPARELPITHALEIEPFLNRGALAAVQVPDAVFEPVRFCLAFLATAQQHGAVVRRFTEVTDFLYAGGCVSGVKVKDHRTGKTENIGADLIINAAGPWVGSVAAMAGISVPVKPTAGVMVTLDGRLNNMVLNRLSPPSDGDIVVPQRATSIIGTTSWEVEDPDVIPAPADHVAKMLAQGEQLLPAVQKIPVRARVAAARPLIVKGDKEAREASRTFECFDHQDDGVEGFVTIAGGKMTTARAMAERVSDLVCKKLGVAVACRTRNVPLVSYRLFYQGGSYA